ncbi:hypothetical protein ANOM_002264, partial [Aspergillus nomiae NRRL 13137]
LLLARSADPSRRPLVWLLSAVVRWTCVLLSGRTASRARFAPSVRPTRRPPLPRPRNRRFRKHPHAIIWDIFYEKGVTVDDVWCRNDLELCSIFVR